MSRTEPCEFCGRRPLSPGGKRLRAYLQAIWSAPTPWEIERAKEAEKAKAEAEVAAALEGHARARGGCPQRACA